MSGAVPAPVSNAGPPLTELRAAYDLGPTVGEGSAGTVFRAVQRSTGRTVAVKLLSNPLDAADRTRFLREGRAMAAIRHPALLSVLDAGEADGIPFVVSEYMDGGSLRGAMRGPWPVKAAVDLVRACLAGLAECHGRGLLHRDVKPENILLTAQREPKLADFGLALDAATFQRLTATGCVVGTPRYLAPEVLRGTPVSARSDLFSMGVTLYELVNGAAPFGDLSPISLLAAYDVGRPLAVQPSRAGVPPALHRLLLATLDGDPEKRPRSAEVLRDLLDPFGSEAVTGSDTAPIAETRGGLPARPRSAALHHAEHGGAHGAHGGGVGRSRSAGLAAVAVIAIGALALLLRPAAPAGLVPPPDAVQAPYHTAMAARDYARAAEYLRARLAEGRTLAWLHLNISVCLEKTNDKPGAMREAEEAARLAPGAAEAHLHLASLHLAAGRSGPARDEFRRAAALDPGSALARHGEAYCMEREGKIAEAQAAYVAVLRDHPDHLDSAVRLADLACDSGDPARAEQLLGALGERQPLPAPAQLVLIRSLLLQHKARPAFERWQRLALSEALAVDPGRALALLRTLALLLEQAGDPEASRAVWATVPDPSSDDLAAALSRGRAHLGAGALEPAAACFARALVVAPDDPTALLSMAQVEIARKRLPQAAALARRVVQLAPAFGPAHAFEARVALTAGDLALAERGAREALRLTPGLADACATLAAALERTGREREAREVELKCAAAPSTASSAGR